MTADLALKSGNTSLIQKVIRLRVLSLTVVAVVMMIFFSIASDRFLTRTNLSHMLIEMSLVIIVGVGVALVLITKNIDVSIGSMVGFSAFFTADFASKNPTLPLIIIVGVSILFGLVLGSFNGLIISTLGVPSIMVTLGTLYIFRGLDSILAGAGQVTSQNLPKSFSRIAGWSFFGIPGMFIYALIVCAFAWIFLQHTYAGRSLLALGNNPNAAKKMGIKSRKWIFIVYALSGALAGFAGVLWCARYGTVDSSTATGFELVVLAAVVVGGINVNGGIGSIGGVLVGASILGIISVGLSLLNVSQFWVQAIQGTAIIVAISSDMIINKRLSRQGAK